MGVDLSPLLDDSDTSSPEFYHHIINQHLPDNSIGDAAIFGTEVIALCGHKFIPTKDPQKYPLCEACRIALSATT